MAGKPLKWFHINANASLMSSFLFSVFDFVKNIFYNLLNCFLLKLIEPTVAAIKMPEHSAGHLIRPERHSSIAFISIGVNVRRGMCTEGVGRGEYCLFI